MKLLTTFSISFLIIGVSSLEVAAPSILSQLVSTSFESSASATFRSLHESFTSGFGNGGSITKYFEDMAGNDAAGSFLASFKDVGASCFGFATEMASEIGESFKKLVPGSDSSITTIFWSLKSSFESGLSNIEHLIPSVKRLGASCFGFATEMASEIGESLEKLIPSSDSSITTIFWSLKSSFESGLGNIGHVIPSVKGVVGNDAYGSVFAVFKSVGSACTGFATQVISGIGVSLGQLGVILSAVGGAATAILGSIYAISVMGFSAVGVTAGSIAAFSQSFIGNVAAGSLFSVLQSLGMAGFSITSYVILGVGGAVWGVLTWLSLL